MSEVGERFEKVAAAFTARVEAVPPDAWDRPAPCEGWVARDVVRHLVEWLPGPGFLLGTFDVETGPIPSVDQDPAEPTGGQGAAGRMGDRERRDPARTRRSRGRRTRRGLRAAGNAVVRRRGGHDVHTRRIDPYVGPRARHGTRRATRRRRSPSP